MSRRKRVMDRQSLRAGRQIRTGGLCCPAGYEATSSDDARRQVPAHKTEISPAKADPKIPPARVEGDWGSEENQGVAEKVGTTRSGFVQRRGQRREPAAANVRASLCAKRLAPVRWTVWFGSSFEGDSGTHLSVPHT